MAVIEEQKNTNQDTAGFWGSYSNYLGLKYANWFLFIIFIAIIAVLHATGILSLISSLIFNETAKYFIYTFIFLLAFPILYSFCIPLEAILKISITGPSRDLIHQQAGSFEDYRKQYYGIRPYKIALSTLVLVVSIYTAVWFLLTIANFNITIFVLLLVTVLPFMVLQIILFFILAIVFYGISDSLMYYSGLIRPVNSNMANALLKISRIFRGVGTISMDEKFISFYGTNLEHFNSIFASHHPSETDNAIIGELADSEISVSLGYRETHKSKRRGGPSLVVRRLYVISFSPAPNKSSGFIRADKSGYTGIGFFDDYPFVFSKNMRTAYSNLRSTIDEFMDKNRSDFLDIKFYNNGTQINEDLPYIEPSRLPDYIERLKSMHETIGRAVLSG